MQWGLRRYWIEFPTGSMLSALRYGVTAIDLTDALILIRGWESQFRRGGALPDPTVVIEDVDVGSLDPGHVAHSIAPPVWRGVWFPRTSQSFEPR
jgi:hypothetical protein